MRPLTSEILQTFDNVINYFHLDHIFVHTTGVIPAKAGIHGKQCKTMSYYVYILSSQRNGTLYIGVTNDLVRRVYEHKNKAVKGFTEKYNIDKLVYIESYEDPMDAIHREKCLKKWNRSWKIRLIEEINPQWKDLSETLI